MKAQSQQNEVVERIIDRILGRKGQKAATGRARASLLALLPAPLKEAAKRQGLSLDDYVRRRALIEEVLRKVEDDDDESDVFA